MSLHQNTQQKSTFQPLVSVYHSRGGRVEHLSMWQQGCSHHGGLEGRKQKGVRGSHNLQKHASKDPPPVKSYLLKFHSLPKLCHQQGNRCSTCKPRVDNGISTQNPQSCGIWSMIRTRVMDPAVKRHREREQRHTHYSVSQNPEQGPSCLCLGWHCLALQ